jgi:hypothetical protein
MSNAQDLPFDVASDGNVVEVLSEEERGQSLIVWVIEGPIFYWASVLQLGSGDVDPILQRSDQLVVLSSSGLG